MNQNLSFNSILNKLERYCAYQDRCTRDVEQKLHGWKVPEQEIKRMVEKLKTERMIDDQRFASSFLRGKLSVNKWGRNRIIYELRSRKIPEAMIREVLQEIDEEIYMETIRSLILRKNREINPDKSLNKRQKIINFVVGKGFEPDLVFRVIQELKI